MKVKKDNYKGLFAASFQLGILTWMNVPLSFSVLKVAMGHTIHLIHAALSGATKYFLLLFFYICSGSPQDL